jgi:hypothetical protein
MFATLAGCSLGGLDDYAPSDTDPTGADLGADGAVDADADAGADVPDGGGDAPDVPDLSPDLPPDPPPDLPDDVPDLPPDLPDVTDGGTDAVDALDAFACDEPRVLYLDSDGDGFGDPETGVETCDDLERHVENGDDCRDDLAYVFPGSHATELPRDGIDVDCDGIDLCLDGRCDGYPDLVLSSTGTDSGRVYYGSEQGLIADDYIEIGLGRAPVLDSGDIDGDGYVDIVTGFHWDRFTGTNFIYWGAATGFTTFSQIHGQGSQQVVVTDFNGDGLDDILIPSAVDPAARYSEGETRIWLGSETRTLPALPNRVIRTPGSFYISVVDVTGDGRPDLVVSSAADNRDEAVLRNVNSRIWTSNSNYAAGFALPTQGAHRNQVLDVDRDGNLDVVFACREQDGSNQAPASLIYYGPDFQASLGLQTTAPSWVGAAQLDGDEGPELIFSGENGISLFPNVGRLGHGGSLGYSGVHAIPSTGDVDGDGHEDLLFPGWNTQTTTLLLWGGPGGPPGEFSDFAAGQSATSLIRDVTGDGRPDLIIGDGGFGGTRVFPNVARGRMPRRVEPLLLGPAETFDIMVLPGKSAW